MSIHIPILLLKEYKSNFLYKRMANVSLNSTTQIIITNMNKLDRDEYSNHE